MASGWGQGAGAGIGLSGAVGMGLGNLVGTLLSGVVAIPGSLIGAGVGALHGPWYSLQDMVTGKGGNNNSDVNGDDGSRPGKNAEANPSGDSDKDSHQEEEAHRAIVEAARKLEQEEEEEKKKRGKQGSEEHGSMEAI